MSVEPEKMFQSAAPEALERTVQEGRTPTAASWAPEEHVVPGRLRTPTAGVLKILLHWDDWLVCHPSAELFGIRIA